DTTKNVKSQPIAFDLSGRARRVDLRRLPRAAKAPPAETNVNAAYHAAGSVVPGGSANVRGDLRFEPATVAGAEIAQGNTVGVVITSRRAPPPRGGSDGADIADIAYRADATVSNLDLERIGREFNVPALATDRYKSTINGRVVADGRGTTPDTMDV